VPEASRRTVTDVVCVVLLVGAAALAWWQPLRVYRCASGGAGLARCTIADRRLVLVPASQWRVDGIAEALFGIGVSHMSVRVGLGLIGRGLLPRSFYQVVYWGPTLLTVVLLAAVWLVALAGGAPSPWLAALLAPAS
jgi:hypothetical protein